MGFLVSILLLESLGPMTVFSFHLREKINSYFDSSSLALGLSLSTGPINPQTATSL